MQLGEIFSNSLKYPTLDFKKLLIIGIVFVIGNIGSICGSYGYDIPFSGIISLIVNIIISGYFISIIKAGINKEDVIPDFDWKKNIVDGIKYCVISIIYLIIPVIVTIILGAASLSPIIEPIMSNSTAQAAIMSGYSTNIMEFIPMDNLTASAGNLTITLIISFILFLIFGICLIVALCRFAKYDSLSEAFHFGDVFSDIKSIGILKIIGYIILAIILVMIISLILGIVSQIPFVGLIIATLLLCPYLYLFIYNSLGLLYSDV